MVTATVKDLTENEYGNDWRYVFAYASGDGMGVMGCGVPECVDNSTHVAPFNVGDVAEVLASADGVQDEYDWLILGTLKDGRFFYLVAGCDYTGWGCKDWGRSYVSATREGVELHVTAEERRRMECEGES